MPSFYTQLKRSGLSQVQQVRDRRNDRHERGVGDHSPNSPYDRRAEPSRVHIPCRECSRNSWVYTLPDSQRKPESRIHPNVLHARGASVRCEHSQCGHHGESSYGRKQWNAYGHVPHVCDDAPFISPPIKA